MIRMSFPSASVGDLLLYIHPGMDFRPGEDDCCRTEFAMSPEVVMVFIVGFQLLGNQPALYLLDSFRVVVPALFPVVSDKRC